eukprot:6187321-Pleurochrysis_carterae.AAC.1
MDSPFQSKPIEADVCMFLIRVLCLNASRHGGDEREGDEKGDDEKIFIELTKVSILNVSILNVELSRAQFFPFESIEPCPHDGIGVYYLKIQSQVHLEFSSHAIDVYVASRRDLHADLTKLSLSFLRPGLLSSFSGAPRRR